MDEQFDNSKKDLIDFINNERITSILTDADVNKVYKLYYKTMAKIIVDVHCKIETLQKVNKEEIIVNGLNMVNYIYFYMLHYSNNIKLTMFFSERAILLYTEFIIMSRNPILNNDFNFTPSINDALQFVYKKTIGPIKPSVNTDLESNIKMLKYIFTDIRLFLLYARKYVIKKNIFNKYKEFLDDSVQYIAPQLLLVYRLDKNICQINKTINDILNILFFKDDLFIHSCYLLKTFLDVFEEIHNITYDMNKTLNILNNCNSIIFNSDNFVLDITEDIFKNKKKNPLLKNIKQHILKLI